jgi:hypothetical protein
VSGENQSRIQSKQSNCLAQLVDAQTAEEERLQVEFAELKKITKSCLEFNPTSRPPIGEILLALQNIFLGKI